MGWGREERGKRGGGISRIRVSAAGFYLDADMYIRYWIDGYVGMR